MTNIISFNFNNLNVRTTLINNNPYFCLKDTCAILDLTNPRQVLTRLDRDGVILNDTVCLTKNQYGKQTEQIVKLNFINEPNLYRVIFRSDKPEAKQFQDFVFNEVLPTLRKTGKYELKENITSQHPYFKNNINIKTNEIQEYIINDPILCKGYFRYKLDVNNNNRPLINIGDVVEMIEYNRYLISPFINDNVYEGIDYYFNLLLENRKDNSNKEIKEKMFLNYLKLFRKEFMIINSSSNNNYSLLNNLTNSNNEIEEISNLRNLRNNKIEEEEINNLNNRNIEALEYYPALKQNNNLTLLNEKLRSATECSTLLGITPVMFGRITNKLNLKNLEHGKFFKETARNNREVQTFRYNQKAFDKVREDREKNN